MGNGFPWARPCSVPLLRGCPFSQVFLIYLIALFTKRNQAVHDLVADTFVVEGRTGSEPGEAWVDEAKTVYEWFRGLFKNGGTRPYLSEKEKLELLEKLSNLRAQGALTEEEYQARKNQILQ